MSSCCCTQKWYYNLPMRFIQVVKGSTARGKLQLGRILVDARLKIAVCRTPTDIVFNHRAGVCDTERRAWKEAESDELAQWNTPSPFPITRYFLLIIPSPSGIFD